jgi:hypothetical protein
MLPGFIQSGERFMSDGLCGCGCGERTTITRTGEPRRFVNGHNRRTSPVDYVEEDRGYDSPCWIWQRARNNKGYGWCQRRGSESLAHRVYYIAEFGPIPDGLELDHRCRVHECVNPRHLEPVTPAINRQRGANAKLDEATVRLIRASPLKARALAAKLGVTHPTVLDVRSGKRWSNVR